MNQARHNHKAKPGQPPPIGRRRWLLLALASAMSLSVFLASSQAPGTVAEQRARLPPAAECGDRVQLVPACDPLLNDGMRLYTARMSRWAAVVFVVVHNPWYWVHLAVTRVSRQPLYIFVGLSSAVPPPAARCCSACWNWRVERHTHCSVYGLGSPTSFLNAQ